MSDAVLVKQVCECVPAWRAQLDDMCTQMEEWDVSSSVGLNVLRELRLLDVMLLRFAESMRFRSPYFEHDLKLARARDLAKRRLAESAARRAKEDKNG